MLVVGTQTNDPKKLIKIDFDGLMHHTLIVGQSGGGKSFLVARVVEEILLRTRARVIIVDPNGDFRKISHPSDSTWVTFEETFSKINSYMATNGIESFDTKDSFLSGWAKRRFTYLAPGRSRPAPQSRDVSQSLIIHWDTLDEEQRAYLLATDARISPTLFMGLKAVTENARWVSQNRPDFDIGFNLRGMKDVCEQFYQSNINLRQYDYAKLLNQDDWSRVRATLDDLLARFSVWWSSYEKYEARPSGLSDFIDGAFRQNRSSSTFWDALILSLDASSSHDTLLSADVALARCWLRAKQVWREAADRVEQEDTRVPTFIVIDEAHNFAPENTTDPLRRRVTERLLQIASEGRKYGLYLILATQRPTKLHRELVPECENACVLRLQSKVETDFASNVLGLSPTEAAQVPGFTLGQGVFIGRWVGGTNQLNTRVAPARISVGGGGLPETWKQFPETTPDLSDATTLHSQFILDALNDSSEAIQFPKFANILQDEFGEDACMGWFGKSTLKNYLQSLQLPSLTFSNIPPGYVYLVGKHTAPTEVIIASSKLTDQQSQAVALAKRFIDIPFSDKETYRLVLEAIYDELSSNPFNLSDTSRNVRDKCIASGHSVGRNLINAILKGIHFSGHSYDADVDQSPPVLAAAFVSSVFFAMEKGGIKPEGDVEVVLRDLLSGGLLTETEKDPTSESFDAPIGRDDGPEKDVP